MSKAQVKIEIDGNLINIEDFLSDTNKTYYAEPIKDGEIEGLRPIAEVVKKQILTDIRDYLVEKKERWKHKKYEVTQIMGLGVEVFIDKALADLTEYAEKLGVEL
jgi:hypothetical protein